MSSEEPSSPSAENVQSESTAPQPQSPSKAPPIPSLRSISDSRAPSNISTNPLGAVNAARRPNIPPGMSPSSPAVATASSFNKDVQAKLLAFQASRQAQQSPRPIPNAGGPGGAFVPPGSLSPKLGRPHPQGWTSDTTVVAARQAAAKPSLGARRGLKLPGGLPGANSPVTGPANPVASAPGGAASDPVPNGDTSSGTTGSLFNKFSDYVDTKTGTLKFKDKATIDSQGIKFSSGTQFSISLDEVQSLDELGKGNYGTVYKVIHRKPKMRIPGAGLASRTASVSSADGVQEGEDGTTGIVMAMKEIRLELDEAKFTAIIMELDILHRCISPFIIDFYGAFFQEGAVYICIEYMDGGSMDKLYGEGVPENVLRRVTWATVKGLKCLKDEHNIIHRDVKPTNILVNTKGEVKLCDFGVSGNLVASIAKTNIGCQSYMAPERIASGGMAQAGNAGGTYSVQSDIWSLGLSILECAMGRYPYPPETYNNIFSQLSAIVDGAPPDLPEEGFSENARDFVRQTLNKDAKLRPSYATLIRHPWFADMQQVPTITEEDEDEAAGAEGTTAESYSRGENGFKEVADWVIEQMDKRKKKIESGGKWGGPKPALHTVALDQVSSPQRTPVTEETKEAAPPVDGADETLNKATEELSLSH